MLWSGALTLTIAAALAGPPAAAAATGRVWELVTPPDPNGRAINGVASVTPDGDRVAYVSAGPMPGAPSGSQASYNLATRTPNGWQSAPLGFPYSVAGGLFAAVPAPVAAADGLSSWVWSSQRPLLPGAPESPITGIYSGGVGGPPTLLAGGESAEVYGTSADARTVVLQTTTALLPADVRSSGRQVYELDDGVLRLVGVDGAGVPLSACGALAGTSYQPNVVSRDGSRVFFSSPDTTSCGGTRRVYLRDEGVVTREVSSSRCTRNDCNAPSAVAFMGATPSGSIAYLATAQQLTNDDVDQGQDLYRYDVATDTLSRVSKGPVGVSAQVLGGNVYSSVDGSRVYFMASGSLVPGQGSAGGKIFVADDQGLRYVATLGNSEGWSSAQQIGGAGEVAQITPDAGRLLFSTVNALTPDDTDAQSDAYLYDAGSGSLTRVTGSGTSGNGPFAADYIQDFGPSALGGRSRRSLTSDGHHVFFRTSEALVAADVNGTIDVYEWDDGALGLITSGAPSGSVRYGTASADGRSVFFTTDESLVPADDDGGDPDLYVARESGGFPPQGGPLPGCSGSDCVSEPPARLSRPIPASVDYVEPAPERFRALPISTRALRRMAASGVLKLTIETSKRGRIGARAQARMGRRTRTVARGRTTARSAGTVRMRLSLSQPAVRWLASGRALRLRVVLRRVRPDRSSVLRLRLPAS